MAQERPQPPVDRLADRIESRLLEERRLFVSGAFDTDMADDVIKKLWFLELQQPGAPLLLVINSPGGSVDAGFAIWDQVKMISSPVTTLVTGIAASMGSVLALCAPKGKRFATPKSRFMIHQPSLAGVVQGQATDLEIQAREMLKTRTLLIQMYVDATGKPADVIEKAIDRDTWMTPDEALAFGLIDRIVTSYAGL